MPSRMGLSAQRGVLRRRYGERPSERPGITNGVGRIILTVLVLAASSVLSGGCSASSSNGSTRANGSDPIEKTQAVVFARAVNLRAADLPGWTSARPEAETTKRGPPFVSELARCGGAIYPALKVGGIGSLFRRGPRLQMELVQSGVLVTPSADVAGRDIAANRGSRVQACVARVITSIQPRGPSGRPVTTISSLPDPLPGVESYGLKVIITAVSGGVTFHGRQDVLGFASGPAVIALVETYPFKGAPLANEHQLLSLLYSRAKAHHL
jgi:hypothetical protein